MTANSDASEALAFLSLLEIGECIGRRDVTSEHVTTELLRRIDRLDARLTSFVTLLSDDALQQARLVDREISMGFRRGPLHGVPVAVKDLLDMAGVPTGAGSVILQNNIATSDSSVVRKLRGAGAVILGKLHTTEAALLDHHPSLPQPRNPWNTEHWTGSSSS